MCYLIVVCLIAEVDMENLVGDVVCAAGCLGVCAVVASFLSGVYASLGGLVFLL